MRLTENDVREIFRLLATNELCHQEIADELGCSRTMVTYINQARYWRHLAPDGWKPAPPVRARGERNGIAKLSEDEARQVFRLAWEGAWTLAQIGEMFGVSLSQVSLIKHRTRWRHLSLDDPAEKGPINAGHRTV